MILAQIPETIAFLLGNWPNGSKLHGRKSRWKQIRLTLKGINTYIVVQQQWYIAGIKIDQWVNGIVQ